MAAWCLPKKETAAFLRAIADGTLDPEKLMGMTSAQRHAVFGDIIGEDNAREVNAQFESKMLLKDQQRGMIAWAKKIGGITEATRTDIVAKIQRLDRVLQPAEEKDFLADLAARRLGVTVTANEAQDIFNLSQTAESRRQAMLQDPANLDARIGYGRALIDLSDRVESMKPGAHSWSNTLWDVLNIPKSALTSILHFSAPFVQGWGMLSTQRAWEAFGQMFRYFASEENYQNLNAYIITHPDYPLAKEGKLGLTKLGDKLSAREEAIQSTLVEQANEWLTENTGIPNLVRMSSRAFTGYLNYVRFNRFADLLNAARLTGEDVRPGSGVIRDLAKVVNDFTGRGELTLDITGKAEPLGLERSATALNATLFSPRKFAATMHMFNPVRYLNPEISPTARQAAIRQLAGSLIATSAVLALAKAMGASVDPDPRSVNFAKIVIGDEKFDLTGGNDTYLRLLARIATNQEINAAGKLKELGQSFGSTTRAGVAWDFMRNKLSPVAGFIVDALYGSNPVGRPFSVSDEMMDKLVPITVGDWIKFAMYDADNYAAYFPALAAAIGVGMETPLAPMARSGRNVWGEPTSAFDAPLRDPVDRQFKALGYTPGFPIDVIRKVRLTGQQYDDYIRISGSLAKMQLDQLLAWPQWNAIPDVSKLSMMKKIIRKSRDIAQTTLMVQGQGTDNDIMRQASDAKAAALAAQPATVQ